MRRFKVLAVAVIFLMVQLLGVTSFFETGYAQQDFSKGYSACSEGAGKAGKNSVYISKAADGTVQYVGITNNLARRAAEHLASKGIKIRELLGGLSRADARSVEQALIEIHGLSKNGGTLMNKINSIAKTNKKYANALERGYDILKSIGYK